MALTNSSVGRKLIPGIPDKETLLQQTYLEAFQANYDSVQRWMRWKEDHEQLKEILTTLPEKLSHDIVIPFGSKALLKAKLVHTNEILACLGEKWFVLQSSEQAKGLCSRRINHSEEMLKMLEKEQTLLLNRQMLPKSEEAFASDDAREIVEEYDEKKETEWRVGHRKREKEFRQKLAELRKQQESNSSVQTEEDLFRRLDALELEEELNDELERLHAEYEDHSINNEDEITTSEEDSEDESEDENDVGNSPAHKSLLSQKPTRSNFEKTEIDNIKQSPGNEEKVSSKELHVIAEDTKILHNNDKIENINRVKKLTFADSFETDQRDLKEECDSDIYIKFRHTSQPSLTPNQSDFKHKTQSALPKIECPSDIYDYHKTLALCHPKSILKKSYSLPSTQEPKCSITSQPFESMLGWNFQDEEDENCASVTITRDLSHLPPVLCDVQEKSYLPSRGPHHEESVKRPVSRFKAARQGAKEK